MKNLQMPIIALCAAISMATSCSNSDTSIQEALMSSDRQTLIEFYEATDGDNWYNNENWCTDAPLEEWYGVITDSEGSVKGLNLGNNDLANSLPESLGNLAKLESMNLSNNDLESAIPSSIGNLSNLESMNLSNNGLKSSVPSSIGSLSNLESMDLSNNELQSSIPSSIGSLSNLETLNLGNNELSSEIPETIGDLKSLEYLNLGNNKLEGSIPAAVGNLSKLEVLDLSYNSISGDIPETLGNLTSLTDLYLQETDLTGEIPQNLIDQGVNVVVDLELVIPEELIGDMANHMPIYDGINPPNIEGKFVMDDMTVVYCEDEGEGGFSPGYDSFADNYLEFYNQDDDYLTVMIKNEQASSSGAGDGAFIRGEGDNFTAFFDVYGTSEGDEGNIINTKMATVVSGTMTSSGIKNMYYAFAMISKTNDLYNDLMAEGVYRVFNEDDGLASRRTTSLLESKSGVDIETFMNTIFDRAK